MAENIDLAKKMVEDIAPVLDEERTDAAISSATLTTEGFLSKPLLTETQVTVEEKVVPVKTIAKKTASATSASAKKAVDGNPTAHYFPYGYCTYYVSQQRFVPWSGNAIAWLSGARSYGYATGSTPQAGAIIVTSEGGKTGHVGMVDLVNGDQVTITEMNYHGFGVISTRTISTSYGTIMGYIY